MKLIFRNSKWILFGLMIFFMGFFSINYVDFKANQLNSDVLNDRNPSNNNDEKLDPNELKKDKSLDVVHSELIEMIPATKETTEKPFAKNDDKEEKRRFIAYDGGGFGSVNSGILFYYHFIEYDILIICIYLQSFYFNNFIKLKLFYCLLNYLIELCLKIVSKIIAIYSQWIIRKNNYLILYINQFALNSNLNCIKIISPKVKKK